MAFISTLRVHTGGIPESTDDDEDQDEKTGRLHRAGHCAREKPARAAGQGGEIGENQRHHQYHHEANQPQRGGRAEVGTAPAKTEGTAGTNRCGVEEGVQNEQHGTRGPQKTRGKSLEGVTIRYHY